MGILGASVSSSAEESTSRAFRERSGGAYVTEREKFEATAEMFARVATRVASTRRSFTVSDSSKNPCSNATRARTCARET